MSAITKSTEVTAITKEPNHSGLQIRTMDDLSRVSNMLAQSGYFTDAKDAAQCGVKVLAGTEMGFGAFASMAGIHIVKGKPSVGANLMAAAVKRHPNYNYRVLEHSSEVCRIEFFERWDGTMQPVGTSEMTMKEAIAAKLNQEWDKQSSQWKDKHNWKTYPKNMLFARAMSNGVKWYCPDVFDAPVYTPDELGAEVNEDGEFVEVETIQPIIVDRDCARLFAIAGSRFDKQKLDTLKPILGVESWKTSLDWQFNLACALVELAIAHGWETMIELTTDFIKRAGSLENLTPAMVKNKIAKLNQEAIQASNEAEDVSNISYEQNH